MVVYCAGAMTIYEKLNQFNKAIEWRKNVLDQFEYIHKVFDPTINFETNKTYDCKGVVYQNLHYLNQADVLLLNLEHLDKSPGTMFEIFYAFFNHKPVIAFGSNDCINQPHVKESITIQFGTLEEALEYIHSMYSQL